LERFAPRHSDRRIDRVHDVLVPGTRVTVIVGVGLASAVATFKPGCPDPLQCTPEVMTAAKIAAAANTAVNRFRNCTIGGAGAITTSPS
jgi:hypothetical protein